uniref:SEC-C metal-binding domain-containing protein n=1 Tax=Sporichthya sp. TaxID=65475 RepID=UPI0017DF2AD9
ALRRWPQLAADGGPAAGQDGPRTHRAYCRAMEEQLARYAGVGSELVVVPLRIDAYLAWCADHGRDAGASDARAGYAADRARLGGDERIAWPPGRKHECWCGSGRRYKRCCGSDR